MGVPTSDVGYTLVTNWRRDKEVHKGHVVGGKKNTTLINNIIVYPMLFI
jgi:hypothetical protein